MRSWGRGVTLAPMTFPMLRPLLRKWTRFLVLGMALLAVLGMAGLLLEQVAEVAVHGHIGHDLPGESARHTHEEQCPSRLAHTGECQAVAMQAGAAIRSVRIAPAMELVIRGDVPSVPTPVRVAVPYERRACSPRTGPPHRPPIV